MTYHVYCPKSKRWFDFESPTHARRFVLGMIRKFQCRNPITVRDGKKMMGRMQRIGNKVVWKSKGMRMKGRYVMEDGSLGEYVTISIRRSRT